MYCPFPVCFPHNGGSLQAPLFALRPSLSQEDVMGTKETYKRKESERETQRKDVRKAPPLNCSHRRHEVGPAPSGLWLFGILSFVLEVRPPAHWCASIHIFSAISRLRLARDCGRGIARASARSSAAILARSTAFSLSVIPLRAGNQLISMILPGLALRREAMCFCDWRAYFCPRPGSSDAIRLMAACASVKLVTRFGVVFLREKDSSA